MKKHNMQKETDEELIALLGPGANRPGGYITYSQRLAAAELRKRGYRVSEMYGTVKKKEVRR